MARIKLTLPDRFDFSTEIEIRISDINYGGHLGNDVILSLIHEARIRFLKGHGYTEAERFYLTAILGGFVIGMVLGVVMALLGAEKSSIQIVAFVTGAIFSIAVQIYYFRKLLNKKFKKFTIALIKFNRQKNIVLNHDGA